MSLWQGARKRSRVSSKERNWMSVEINWQIVYDALSLLHRLKSIKSSFYEARWMASSCSCCWRLVSLFSRWKVISSLAGESCSSTCASSSSKLLPLSSPHKISSLHFAWARISAFIIYKYDHQVAMQLHCLLLQMAFNACLQVDWIQIVRVTRITACIVYDLVGFTPSLIS